MKTKPSKGFLVVGTCTEQFYRLAVNCAESILDYYPDAKVALGTEERFFDGREKQFDHVITCPDHYRAKLYGMANSPYDHTMYIDADCEIQHQDIATAFDHLHDNDMVFTPLGKFNEHAFAMRYFNDKAKKEEDENYAFQLNGGVCLYNNSNPLIKEFMSDWWDYYQKQRTGEWWPTKDDGVWDTDNYPRENRFWDQFTLWWLLNKEPKYSELKVGHFPDYLRWNYYHGMERRNPPLIPEDDPIILHRSGLPSKWNKW